MAIAIIMLLSSLLSAGDTTVDRGAYLVRSVAMCTDCHGATLHGGTVPGAGVKAPSLARGAGLSESQIASYLEHGTMPPPMPHYHMNAVDAAAIARYLTSVR